METVQDEYERLFQQLKEDRESWERIWKGIEEDFTNHTTKNSDKESIRNSVLEQANSTCERMKGYWSLLLTIVPLGL